MSDFLALAQPGVQKLSPYVPGKPVDELARELGIDPAAIVKLASNENPLGASPKALEAIRAELAEFRRAIRMATASSSSASWPSAAVCSPGR